MVVVVVDDGRMREMRPGMLLRANRASIGQALFVSVRTLVAGATAHVVALSIRRMQPLFAKPVTWEALRLHHSHHLILSESLTIKAHSHNTLDKARTWMPASCRVEVA